VGGGLWLGNIPWVKENLSPVLAVVVLVSVGSAIVGMARRLRGEAGGAREDGSSPSG
jgi:hypothetical protein